MGVQSQEDRELRQKERGRSGRAFFSLSYAAKIPGLALLARNDVTCVLIVIVVNDSLVRSLHVF